MGSQGPHTRPLPVEAGEEEGLAGVFLLPKILNIANKNLLNTSERAHSGGYRIGKP